MLSGRNPAHRGAPKHRRHQTHAREIFLAQPSLCCGWGKDPRQAVCQKAGVAVALATVGMAGLWVGRSSSHASLPMLRALGQPPQSPPTLPSVR